MRPVLASQRVKKEEKRAHYSLPEGKEREERSILASLGGVEGGVFHPLVCLPPYPGVTLTMVYTPPSVLPGTPRVPTTPS